MSSCAWAVGPFLKKYHDEEWGVPVHDETKHYEFLVLEAMSCGLSWELMLKKREVFRTVFADFDFRQVAKFTDADVERIMGVEGMIRSPRKIRAMIHNARCFLAIEKEFGSFDHYIWGFTKGKTLVYHRHQEEGEWETRNELSDALAKDMKKRGFKYLGSVILYSHLQAIGIINDHELSCPRYPELLKVTDVEYR
ncbi:MAG: DNA-3-methyladenine glycosylase I [Prevotella sp.]|jgi:DNA-3-methyladenine glycosylase I|nr:DNA-3-methyladenine glycosylase I [Prevotella sp.]